MRDPQGSPAAPGAQLRPPAQPRISPRAGQPVGGPSSWKVRDCQGPGPLDRPVCPGLTPWKRARPPANLRIQSAAGGLPAQLLWNPLHAPLRLPPPSLSTALWLASPSQHHGPHVSPRELQTAEPGPLHARDWTVQGSPLSLAGAPWTQPCAPRTLEDLAWGPALAGSGCGPWPWRSWPPHLAP